ncbi:NACHT domain-containing NTPase [Streptomyces sp. A012304]|uniref:NACHT domain-containing protein n=1 Tax=Streptomyces sp. A012304 TaxID=375446 RepID=UPI00222E389F|nr:NACHT domain-containing protein [Streptomyces sp. A012304]GKQ38820.1 hypothetical protein ALMP_53490 [Streptomyces sp. A012304]
MRERGLRDAEFESRYADYLRAHYGTLDLFGLDTNTALRRIPLTASYLGLRATWGRESPEAPVEELLAAHPRAVLRGPVGSGKTTVLRRLALRATDAGPRGAEDLVGRVPFLLPLRWVARDAAPLPGPQGFLDMTGAPLSAEQPDGWAERVLAEGRGLLLVDGADEIPAPLRERVRDWLRALLAVHPDTRCVVTSRPSAVAEDWLADLGFTDCRLVPMTQGDVRRFLTLWYEGWGLSPAARDRAQDPAAELFAVVARAPELSELATNPLMCAILCALYEERRGFVPLGRIPLYDALLSLLLGRRDAERGVGAPEGLTAGEAEQRALLQRIAYWMQRNGLSEITTEQAAALIAQSLPAMPRMDARTEPWTVLRQLLSRSGVLQEAGPDAIGFLHRTVHSYLAACAVVDDGDTGVLVHRADSDDWQEVVRLAVGVARRPERTEILRGLLARAGREPRHRVRLVLLAGAALQLVPVIEPALRKEIQDRLAELIPPRTRAAAGELAGAGALVLELLPGPDAFAWLSPEALLVMHTAELVGGAAAEEFLRRFHTLPASDSAPYGVGMPERTVVSSVQVDTWTPHPCAPVPERRSLELTGAEPADDLTTLAATVSHVVCRGDTPLPVHVLRALPLLHTLEIVDNPSLTDLQGLGGLRRLRTLRISGCPALGDLTALAGSGVVFLELAPSPGRAVLRALSGARRLRVLGLRTSAGESRGGTRGWSLPGVEIRTGTDIRI